MEACAGAHHWAREFQSRGYTVKLIPPQFVKPYVKSNKNDAKDSEATCKAMSRPNMRFVTVKSVEQQDIQATHRIRAELITQRTAKANQIRGLVAEYGLLLDTFYRLKVLLDKTEPGCVIGMEACAGAHHWARELQSRGYTVKLIPPQFVKPYVKSNKNDARDAEAICEAMSRPNMRFVTVKTVAQQDIQATHRVTDKHSLPNQFQLY